MDWQKIKKGDISEFEKVFKRYYSKLVLYAQVFIEDKQTADEIVSDVFYSLWQKRQNISPQNLKSYLYASVKNKAISMLRKKNLFISIENIDCKKTEKEQQPDYQLIKKEEKNNLQNLLKLIPPRSREVFILHKYEGMKYKEIAEFLNISPNTVENHIVKAMKILRQAAKKSNLL